MFCCRSGVVFLWLGFDFVMCIVVWSSRWYFDLVWFWWYVFFCCGRRYWWGVVMGKCDL